MEGFWYNKGTYIWLILRTFLKNIKIGDKLEEIIYKLYYILWINELLYPQL